MMELITSLLQNAGICVITHSPLSLHRMCSANFVNHFSVFCFVLIISSVAIHHVVNTEIYIYILASQLVLPLYYISLSGTGTGIWTSNIHTFEMEIWNMLGIIFWNIYYAYALPFYLLNLKYTSLWHFKKAAHLTDLLCQQRVCNFE